jgi:hypothetical protein
MEQSKKYIAHYVKSLNEMIDCKGHLIQVHPDKTIFSWVEIAYEKGDKKTIEISKITEHSIPLYPKEGYLTVVEKLN